MKLNKVQTINPHTSKSIPIPEKFKSHSEVLIEPLENKSFRKPGVYEVHHGMVKLENSSHISQAMSKDDFSFYRVTRQQRYTSVCKYQENLCYFKQKYVSV